MTARLSSPLFGAAALTAILAALAGFATPAQAKSTQACANAVIADWFNDGRVDKIYSAACYREAVKALPPDVATYSSARDDILRALSYALRGKNDPGDGGTGSGGGGGVTIPVQTAPTTTPEPTSPTTTAPSTDTTPVATDTTDAVTDAAGADSSGPSSVPIPLLVLGGLAVLLFAAGIAAYLARRFRSGGGPDGSGPPASA